MKKAWFKLLATVLSVMLVAAMLALMAAAVSVRRDRQVCNLIQKRERISQY